MKATQIITGAVRVLWMLITTLFYLAANAFEKEKRTATGYELYVKYTPEWWKRITRWVVLPALITYALTLLYQKLNRG